MPTWTDALATGIAAIDRQHQALFAAMEGLVAASELGSDQAAAAGHWLDLLRDHATIHFSEEETEMEKAGYPRLAQHRGAHQRIASQVLALVERQQQGSTIVFPSVRSLGELMVQHVQGDDRAYATWQRRRRATGKPASRAVKKDGKKK